MWVASWKSSSILSVCIPEPRGGTGDSSARTGKAEQLCVTGVEMAAQRGDKLALRDSGQWLHGSASLPQMARPSLPATGHPEGPDMD